MLNKQKIRKLASITAESSRVSRDIEEYVLTKMSKQELKDFLKYLKMELDKKRVYVISSEAVSKENLSLIKRKFEGKRIVETLDKSLGGGLKIRDNDLVIDFSFKKFINDTIERIKS